MTKFAKNGNCVSFGCNPQTNEWTPYNAETTTPSAPSWGASAESTNLQLGFYFNGITGEMNTSTASGVETLMVINLQTHTVYSPMFVSSESNGLTDLTDNKLVHCLAHER